MIAIQRRVYEIPNDLRNLYYSKLQDVQQWLVEECEKRGIIPTISCSVSDPEHLQPIRRK